jgi:mannose-6-phosphate isomerase
VIIRILPMPDLYPFLLRPQFHERVWGARNLSPVYGHQITGNPVGEAWLTGDTCTVANGPLAGQTLADVTQVFGSALLGQAVPGASRFPLLIKFLFPREKLSVQVHPDDEQAARVGQPNGKTECWYILRAEPGAQVAVGLNPGVTKAEVERAIRETRMEELLQWIDVHQGNLIYVDAGTVHAIGPGSVIMETQQNSDTTYRLYDYGRGRELHIKDGLAAIKERTHAGKVAPGAPHSEKGKTQVNLVTSGCFVVDKFALKKPWEFRRPRHNQGSVWCLTAYQGCAIVEGQGSAPFAPFTWTSGETVVVPAAVESFTVKPQWEIEFLCASLPAEKVGHPQTLPF